MKPVPYASGFDALPVTAWPEIAAVLSKPWPQAAAEQDLRWHAGQVRMTADRERASQRWTMPGYREFELRWGWGGHRVRKLMAAECEWRDQVAPTAETTQPGRKPAAPTAAPSAAVEPAFAADTGISPTAPPAAPSAAETTHPGRKSGDTRVPLLTDHRSPITGDTHSGGKPPTPPSPASEAYAAWRAAHPRAPTKPTPDARRAVERILVETAGVEHAAVYFAWVELSADEAACRLRGEAPWPDGTVTRRDDLESLSRHIPARLPLALAWEERGRRDAPRAAPNSPALDAWLAMLAGRWPTDGPAAAALRAIGGSSAVRARTSFDEPRLRDRFLATYDTQPKSL